ncbi:DUF1294 domain-containing protein [Bordetella petrii]|uniref:Integral membrane protein n=1 Tax=Bordetella petrii (strain ATCC BAA-461 / DSM 12804 / CCUG 43448 / CIP 107267 / Se-1111R) TaxID=340100 RepID=A9I5P6_BORPD|nr:DUF1294 domain-containing protein [Bordetella petrii]CAP41123.1 hypothetical protein predicted by Glimmer/Critica [Bordetella petrii]
MARHVDPQGKRSRDPGPPTGQSRRATRKPAPAKGLLGLLAAALLLGVIAAADLLGRPTWWMAWVYPVASALAFLVYAIDKSAARAAARRIPENTLHLLALAGGWPGAWAAQRMLRHKSSKTRFLAVFWCTALINVAAFVLLAFPEAWPNLKALL